MWYRSNGQDYHPRGGVFGHHRQCEDKDPGQGRDSSRPAAAHLRRQAVGGRAHPGRLQHPEGVDAAPGAPAARWCEEEEEKNVHEAQEAETQEEESEASGPPVLQGGRLREGTAFEEGVPEPRVRRRNLHGEPLRPSLLREVRSDIRVPEGRRRVEAGSVCGLGC